MAPLVSFGKGNHAHVKLPGSIKNVQVDMHIANIAWLRAFSVWARRWVDAGNNRSLLLGWVFTVFVPEICVMNYSSNGWFHFFFLFFFVCTTGRSESHLLLNCGQIETAQSKYSF